MRTSYKNTNSIFSSKKKTKQIHLRTCYPKNGHIKMGVSLLKINSFGIWEMDGKGGWEDCQEDQSIILSLISPQSFGFVEDTLIIMLIR